MADQDSDQNEPGTHSGARVRWTPEEDRRLWEVYHKQLPERYKTSNMGLTGDGDVPLYTVYYADVPEEKRQRTSCALRHRLCALRPKQAEFRALLEAAEIGLKTPAANTHPLPAPASAVVADAAAAAAVASAVTTAAATASALVPNTKKRPAEDDPSEKKKIGRPKKARPAVEGGQSKSKEKKEAHPVAAAAADVAGAHGTELASAWETAMQKHFSDATDAIRRSKELEVELVNTKNQLTRTTSELSVVRKERDAERKKLMDEFNSETHRRTLAWKEKCDYLKKKNTEKDEEIKKLRDKWNGSLQTTVSLSKFLQAKQNTEVPGLPGLVGTVVSTS